jgi:hypothetical protein
LMNAPKEAGRQWAATMAWILLVLASMVMIGYGIWHAGWHIWLPRSTEQENVWIGNRYILAGSALSIAAAVWSGAREDRVWVTVCVGLPGVLVGWAMMDDPYDLKRHLAAVVSFPLALAGVAEVIRVHGRRQR